MFGSINSDMVGSAVRSVLIFGGGFLVSKNYISAADLPIVAGAIAAAIAAVWGVVSKAKSKVAA